MQASHLLLAARYNQPFIALNLTFRDAYADAQHAWPK